MNFRQYNQEINKKMWRMMIFIALYFFVVTVFALPPSSMVDTKKYEAMNAVFTELCVAQKFSGAALIAINGKVFFQKACGLANRDFKVNNSIKTKHNLASVGKLFTSLAIAQLIDNKQLSLNTSVHKLVPWIAMKDAESMTIEQLLTHSSGLGNYMDNKQWQLGADSGLYLNTNDHKPLIAGKKLIFKPGDAQAYSNSAYLVLGAVIEKISGKSYSDYINKHILKPAKMFDTGTYPLDAIVENRAVGYFYSCKDKKCQWKNNEFSAPFIGTAAGGAYSTVDDLFKFSQSLYHGTLLSPKFTEQILSTRLAKSKVNQASYQKKFNIGGLEIQENMSPYGFAGAWNTFGFALWKNPDLIGHTGGTKGAAALLAMSPDNRYTIILLSNIDNGTTLLYQKIREILGFQGAIENF